MCRSIKTLFNFEPPATDLEIRDASLQFVRKLSGFNVPSQANQAAFDRAVLDMAATARTVLDNQSRKLCLTKNGFLSATLRRTSWLAICRPSTDIGQPQFLAG